MTDEILSGGRIGDRFPTNEQILQMVREGHPMHLGIPGDPSVALFVTEGGLAIGLELPPGEIPKDLNPYTAIQVQSDEKHVRISSTNSRLFPEFSRLLAAIAERVQVQGRPSGRAIAEALEDWRGVLQREHGLSHEREVGLLGELWTVWRLIVGGMAPSDAVSAWRGSESEEHDFGLSGLDLEVKSTSSEHRIHVISSLSQLVPTGNRPLWMLSLQFTAAGVEGRTLAEFIQLARALVPADDPNTLASYDSKVRSVVSDRSNLIDTRWRLRQGPTLIRVDDTFPRLTPTMLDSLPADIRVRFHEVWYRINVEGLGEEDGMPMAAGLLGPSPERSPWI